MSIEVLASDLSVEFGPVTIVAAKGKGGFKSLKAVQSSKLCKEPAHREYAAAYYKWVEGGRKGNPPADSAKDPLIWKRIRQAVQQALKA